jgi:Short C-terminal domain
MPELEQLARLRDQTVITAEDFEAKKKQILGI